MSFPLNLLAYKYIREKIMSNRVVAGQKLSETQLANELGVSRTPVREAIQQLCNEGVLYQVPSSGTFVAMPDRKEIIEAYEIRELLECSMLCKAVKKILPRHRIELWQHLKQMRTAVRAMRDAGNEHLTGEPLHQFLEADMATHALILKIAGNAMATQIVNEAQLRNRIFGSNSHSRDLLHISRALLLHSRLIRAICKGDGKMAKKWMRAHIRESRNEAIATFDQQTELGDLHQAVREKVSNQRR